MTRIKVTNCHEAQVTANAWDAKKQLFHWIAISSFTEPTALTYQVPPSCLSFTRFIFDDVEEGELKPFDERMAYLAIQLFYHINTHFTPILINCDAGISRSAAFASFYHDYIICSRDPNPFEVPPYHPNAHVKRVFKKELYGV